MPQVNPTPALPWGQASTGKDGALGSVAQATEQQLEQEHLANPDQVGLAIADGGELSSPPSKRRRADPLSSDVEQPNHLGLALSDVGLQIGRRIEVIGLWLLVATSRLVRPVNDGDFCCPQRFLKRILIFR